MAIRPIAGLFNITAGLSPEINKVSAAVVFLQEARSFFEGNAVGFGAAANRPELHVDPILFDITGAANLQYEARRCRPVEVSTAVGLVDFSNNISQFTIGPEYAYAVNWNGGAGAGYEVCARLWVCQTEGKRSGKQLCGRQIFTGAFGFAATADSQQRNQQHV